MSIGSEERDAVLRVMDRGILSGYKGNWSEAFYGGEEIRALEKEWQSYFGVKHAIATNSATSGLWLACAAVGLSPQDSCIVTPYSMTCSASMPLLFGAEPIFADIEPDYFCLDPDSVERAILSRLEDKQLAELGYEGYSTKKVKAIIVVDLFGQPYDADAINAIAKKHNIMVIEDAAQAAGATYKGRYTGTLGDIGVFSLNVHKPITCGEGGVVVTDNDELAFKIRLLMNHSEAVINDMTGKIIPNNSDTPLRAFAQARTMVGMNLRMTELSAAVAREQLKKLAGIVERVRYHAARSFNIDTRPDCSPSFYRYAWTDCSQSHFDYYIGRHIFNIKRHYITPIFEMPLFRSLGYDQDQCPVCRDVDEHIVLAWLKEEL